MVAFFVGAVVVSALGGPLILGLLFGGLAALVARPLRRDPPWTARGRSAWRRRARVVGDAFRAWRAFSAAQIRQPNASTPPPGDGSRGPDFWPVDPNDLRDAARFDAAFEVRCEVVTERLQVWHSTDTGRAYEIDARSAPVDARPGDTGWLAFDGGRPRVRAISGERRILN
jgi:hypothetical protein